MLTLRTQGASALTLSSLPCVTQVSSALALGVSPRQVLYWG